MRNKILSLLVLLLTAATGAWSEESESITTTLPAAKTGSVEFTGTHFKITGQRADKDGMNLGSSTNRTITISALNGEIITKVEMTIGFKFYSWEWDVLSTKGNVSGKYESGKNLTLTDVNVSEVTLSASNTTTGYLQFNKFKIFYTMPAGTMTLNTDNTVATMTMPANDVTVNYELVRDMAVSMTTKVGDGEDGAEYRIRVKKDGESFVPAEMTLQQMMALFNVHDGIENQDLVFYGDGKVCDISIFAVDDQDQPTGDAIAFAALTPGRYVAIATAVDDSAYDGTTAPSNIFQLYQGYEVEIAGGEFITYYKDEAIYVEDEDVHLFSITAVGETTATATQFDVIPANKAMLVKNNSAEPKTVLLIPTETDPLSFTWYEGFVGTLEATTILASDATTDRYAFNGKQFVRVKNDLAVGANKAWLEIPAANNARIINISFEETTGLSEERIVKSEEFATATWYTIEGRKLDKMPTKKGVYILNGRKVVVK